MCIHKIAMYIIVVIQSLFRFCFVASSCVSVFDQSIIYTHAHSFLFFFNFIFIITLYTKCFCFYMLYCYFFSHYFFISSSSLSVTLNTIFIYNYLAMYKYITIYTMSAESLYYCRSARVFKAALRYSLRILTAATQLSMSRDCNSCSRLDTVT